MVNPPGGAYVPKAPYQPTAKEHDDHEATGHVYFRSWCNHCVAARARVHPHYKAPVEEPDAVPTIIIDYLFMGEDDGKTIPMLAVKDRKSKAKWADAVQKKGNDAHACSVVTAAIRETGYRRIVLQE